MIYHFHCTAEGTPALLEFFKAICDDREFDTVPPLPERYEDTHAWAKDLDGMTSPLYRILTRSDTSGRAGNVVVRFVPLASKVTIFEASYAVFEIAFKRFADGGWMVEFQIPSLNARMHERVLKGLLQFTPQGFFSSAQGAGDTPNES